MTADSLQESLSAGRPVALKTSASHRVLALVSAAFLCFEFAFLICYFDRSWFSLDLRPYGLPAVIIAGFVGHLFLNFFESGFACRFFSFIFKGRPPVVYRNWLQLNEEGLVFGRRFLRYEAIDELELSFMGNLVIKSRLVCGKAAPEPDKLLKLPFAVADQNTQLFLLSELRRRRSELILNARLLKIEEPERALPVKIGSPVLRAILAQGPQLTQMATAAIMALLLLDIGWSSCYYLELLKNYFLAQTDMLDGNPQSSERHFERAEQLRLQPLPISWVSAKFLKSSTVAAGIWEERSRALWLQGKHASAIEDGQKAIDEAPTNLRRRLYQSRLLVAEQRPAAARQQLEKILDDHKHSLMPRLYNLAIVKETSKNDPAKISPEYRAQLDACYEEVYAGEPHWPPGGNTFFTELFYSEDTRFLLDRFLGMKYEPEQNKLK